MADVVRHERATESYGVRRDQHVKLSDRSTAFREGAADAPEFGSGRFVE